MSDLRTCTKCQIGKPIDQFYSYSMKHPKRPNERRVVTRTDCKACIDKRTRAYHRKNRDRQILNNCRRSDERLGMKCTLTREHIRNLISHPCSYCGDTDKIGLDRVENTAGYIPENVVACCIRCNCIKRDMPVEAWKFIAPKIREARERGLFGSWVGHNFGDPFLDPRVKKGRRPPRKYPVS